MARVVIALSQFVKDDEGQDLLEYGLLAVLIAVAAIVAVRSMGVAVDSVFWQPIAQAI